jgi:twinkle protein
MIAKILGPIGTKAIESRGLCPETVARFGVYTAKRNADGEVVPDAAGNIVTFPFDEHGVTVAEKYRAPGKKFWQRTGGRKTFWNSDALDDPALLDGRMALIITEGELDALTAIDCGFPLTVSVPDGAPPALKEGADKIVSLENEGTKFDYMLNNKARLKAIKRFVIAVDNDAPGQRLASELVRRLSASRCRFVIYPEGCKDLNDVLMKHGPQTVTAVLNGAKDYPVKGVYRFDDYPDKKQIETFSTGWETVDQIFKPFVPSFTVVTGVPGHGKSSWLMNLLVNLAELHGWKSAVFSPEMPVVPHLRDKMRRIAGRRAVPYIHKDCLADIDRWLGEHFLFIDHQDDDDSDMTLDWLLDRAEDAVFRYGIRALVIDPWNEVDHAKRRDETMTEYIARGVRELKKFGRKYELAVFVVVHPTKDVGKDGKSRVPSLYDCDGSATWFNKPDVGIVIDRPDARIDESTIYVSKIRFEGTGEKGSVKMKFDRETSRYELLDHNPQLDMIA